LLKITSPNLGRSLIIGITRAKNPFKFMPERFDVYGDLPNMLAHRLHRALRFHGSFVFD